MSGSSIEIFTELREIFPFETLNNLKKAASFFKNDRVSLEAFVQGCLGTDHFPDLPNQTDFELEDFLRVQFETLKELLPEGDPAFIEEMFNTHAGTAGMEAAAMDAIMHNSYPKKTVPKQKQTKFDVQLYCELVPDPLASYSHRNFIMTEIMTNDAVEYLLKIFGEGKRAEITSVVKDKQCLYLSYKKLSEVGVEAYGQFFTNVQTVQPKTFESPDYKQVFEKLFIENEGVILSFLTKKREVKSIFQRECKICCGPSRNMIKICTDGHEMCAQCVKAYTESSYHEGKFFFDCVFGGCSLKLSNAVIRSVWDTSLYSKLLEDCIFKSKADNPVVACPFCNFQNGYSDSPEICCSHCLKKFCVTCRKIGHLPLECNKRENDLCKLVEEKMTEELIRKCPQCKRSFIKERGCCNRMWCSQCHLYMCYVCRKVLKDSSYNHFYGQGQLPSEAPGRCPLYSDINTLHVNRIIKSGKEMLDQIKSNNPDLKLLYDPLAVLPKKERSDAVPNQF